MYGMNIWLLVVGIILLPIFLPAGLVMIGLAVYNDFTSVLEHVKKEHKDHAD